MEDYIKDEFGSLEGDTIIKVRSLTADEMDLFGWDASPYHPGFILILKSGRAIVPSADPEGNGPGHLFVEEVA